MRRSGGWKSWIAAALTAAALATPPASASIRYEEARNRIVVRGQSVTLPAILAALPQAPLGPVDRAGRVWLLRANLVLSDGARLTVQGGDADGSVNELRLQSDPPPNGFVSITADYGSIELRDTRVISWDRAAAAPDTRHVDGRAFIRVRSRWEYRILEPLDSRMDILRSEVGWLGYDASESYGLVWKVMVEGHGHVRGDVVDSRIHDNYIGLYTSGAEGGNWRNNEVFGNVLYGLAPHNGSDGMLIERNNVHHNGRHGITLRQHCARAVLRQNRAWSNGASGIDLHLGANDAKVEGNTADLNGDNGIWVYASHRVRVTGNVAYRNGYAGIALSGGSSDGTVRDNESRENRYGLYADPGGGEGAAMPRRNVISGNRIVSSGVRDIRTSDAGANRIEDNQLVAAPRPAAPAEAASLETFSPPPKPRRKAPGATVPRDADDYWVWAALAGAMGIALLLRRRITVPPPPP